MAFITQATQTPLNVIDTIANQLIATGTWVVATGTWYDNDLTLTTAGTPPARSLKYMKDGSTELYVTFVAGIWGRTGAYYSNMGILVFVSSAWDNVNHIPSGTVRTLQMPFKNFSITWPTTYTYAVNTWIYYERDILSIMAATDSPSSYNDSIFFFTMERESTKEYDDAQTNFFFWTSSQKAGYYDTASANTSYGVAPYSWNLPAGWNGLRTATNGIFKFVHPWLSSYPTSRQADSVADAYYNFEYTSGVDFAVRNACISPMRARKSAGDSKVYMAYPIVFNDVSTTWNIPIKAMKSFFAVEPGQGLASGDMVTIPLTWNGSNVTWRYMYINQTSPDGLQLDIAIKYDEV